MRRNIDPSQEKGTKYEYLTFEINQANKKEEVIDVKHEHQKVILNAQKDWESMKKSAWRVAVEKL